MAAKPVNGRLLLLAPASTWRAGWVLVSVSGAVPPPFSSGEVPEPVS